MLLDLNTSFFSQAVILAHLLHLFSPLFLLFFFGFPAF